MAHGLSPIEWEVKHAAEDMDAAGVYPSGDRVVAALEDWPEAAVRVALARLTFRGDVAPATPRGPGEGDPDDDAALDLADVLPDAPLGPGHRDGSADERRWNVALFKLVHGRPGIYRQLSILTGLSPNALKSRVKRVHLEYAPEEIDTPEEVDAETIRNLEARYGRHSDPAVRQWLATLHPAQRAHPDRTRFRRADAAPAPV